MTDLSVAKVFGAEAAPGTGPHGIARVRLWRYGRWETVVVDDRLPTPGCIATDEAAEVWPAVIEKAFAKYEPNLHLIYLDLPCHHSPHSYPIIHPTERHWSHASTRTRPSFTPF